MLKDHHNPPKPTLEFFPVAKGMERVLYELSKPCPSVQGLADWIAITDNFPGMCVVRQFDEYRLLVLLNGPIGLQAFMIASKQMAAVLADCVA